MSTSTFPTPACGGTLSAYELEREARLVLNKQRLAAIGIPQQTRELRNLDAPRRVKVRRAVVSAQPETPLAKRRSSRLNGGTPEHSYAELEDAEELFDLMGRGALRRAPGPSTSVWQEAIEQQRCLSQGRGSIYDSVAGITCHFCRQKKLCGEADCPRCESRDISKACIGKSECSKCHSATGRFCRACLLIRYGQQMEDVKQTMSDGKWLCPHCYEEEHPDEGWICNSSICMKRCGLRPTGIAIYEAQSQGFPSVAHYLQAQMKKRGGAAPVSQAQSDSQPSCCPPSTPPPTEPSRVQGTRRNRRQQDAEQEASVSQLGSTLDNGTRRSQRVRAK